MTDISDIRVFLNNKFSACCECNLELELSDFIVLNNNRETVCLGCADLSHLVYLPSGDAALTRRAKKYSKLSAVVFRFSHSRKRNERQGLLVEEFALTKAEKECLADYEARSKQRERNAVRREILEIKYVEQFAKHIRRLFPNCPPNREREIAEHACMKYSGRIGRTEDAKIFSEGSITLAVIAHIRHIETSYDEFLMNDCDRQYAREKVQDKVDQVLNSWRICAKSACRFTGGEE